MAGFQIQVADHGGGEVDENALAADLEVADVIAYHSANAIEPAAFPTIGKRRLELPDQHICVVRQCPARFEQSIVDAVDFADLGNREVVERQAGDDVVVNRFAFQVFHGCMDQPGLVAVWAKARLHLKAALHDGYEPAVEFHQIELIARQKTSDDLARDRAGTRSHFKNARRCTPLAKLRHQCKRQKTTTWKQASRISKMATRFADEVPAFRPDAHPQGLSTAGRQDGRPPERACSLTY